MNRARGPWPGGASFRGAWPLEKRRAGLVIGLALLAVALWAVFRTPAVTQPVVFNHRKHTEQLKLACSTCHQYVEVGAHAGLPDAKTCVLCHQDRQGTSPEALRVTQLLARGDPLRFNKLFRLPPHVYFTHRRHVGIARLPCKACHGEIAATEQPPARPLVTIRMRYCLGCHASSGQPVDCVRCHR